MNKITPEYINDFQKRILETMQDVLLILKDYESELGKTRGTSIVITETEKLIAVFEYFMCR